jgi:hypothetical protein
VERTFEKELAALGLAGGTPGPVVTEADVAPLPPAVQRYLRFMGVPGRPRDTSFRLQVTGRFRRSHREPWMAAEARQYNSRPDVARVFYLRVRMMGIPVLGRDTYLAGKGRMLVRPLDLFTVADGRGPEYDLGELVTFLNDAVLLAPSMLLGPGVGFAPVDDGSFDVTLTDRGTTVSARVFLDARGAPVDFSTTDRFGEDPFRPGRPLTRARWTTPVEGWREEGGRKLPTRGSAVWHFEGGDLSYAELDFPPGALAFNVPAGR